ncbi:MAG: ATP synthase subunit I [Acidobacteriia bacterium]|nr:ATP synthase subunit I [Terriglobia bacterium]
MAQPDSTYRTSERRIEWLTLALGFAAAAFAAVRWEWRAGAGVALGSLLAWINFRWLKQGVAALVEVSTAQAGSEHARVPFGVYLKFFGRFALLLLVVYVILSRSIFPALAVLAGLFSVVGAVLLEMIVQLLRGKQDSETHP